MKVLFCGDVVGKSGRRVIVEKIPEIRQKLKLDFVVVNGENAAHGFGITRKICNSFYQAGVDVITTGNHVWDQAETMNAIDGDSRLLRPLNELSGTPGRGAGVFTTSAGARVMVIHPIGLLFMTEHDDPFEAVEKELSGVRLGRDVDCIMVDFHAEATSEKMAMGNYLDGRVSAVLGSHVHVPTADAQVLVGGTAYQTDAGMCGDYDSVIGMKKEAAVARFTDKKDVNRLEPATGEATLCAIYVETDDNSGLARQIMPLRVGGRLSETWPV